MKKLLLQIHRLLALTVGVLIVATCFSGAALVFRDALTPIVSPALRVSTNGEAFSYERVLATARKLASGGERVEIRPHADPSRATLLVLHGESARFWHLNPHTGAIVGELHGEGTLFETLFRFHRYFLADERGEILVATLAFLLIVLAGSGVWMWWPRRWAMAWRIRRGGDRLAFNYDLHKAAGSLIVLFLLVNATTGLVMIFSDASTAFVNRIFAGAPVSRPVPVAEERSQPPPLLDDMVAVANAAFQNGVVTQIMIRNEGRLVVVRKRTSAEHNPLGGNRVFIDGRSGVLLGVIPLERQPPGIRMYEWLYPLHTGMLFGAAHQLILMVVGVSTLLMLITGLIVWQARRWPAKTSR